MRHDIEMQATGATRQPNRLAWADQGLGVALLVATLAAWPLLTRASLPTLTDAHHHIYRTYEVLVAWREGILYPRWAPDFYYGFGYPVFNYYSTLTYYLAAAYGWFFGPVAGVKFVFVLASYLGAVGVYLFARDEWGPAAAVVSTAAFSFTPYIVLVDPVLRGAAPETLAIALAPWVLWSCTRLVRTGSRRFFLLAALSLAAMVVAHNLMSFVFVGLLGAWLLWDALLGRRPAKAGALVVAFALLAAAGALALALTAYMWLPAALERNAVQFQNAFTVVQPRRFLSFSELFRPMTTRDVQPFYVTDFSYRLGWPQWMLGLLGALTVLRRTPHRRATLFFFLVTLPCLWIMVPQSAWLWDHVGALPYLQFSFRLLGVSALSLAWLAGAAVDWAGPAWLPVSRYSLAVFLATICVVAGLPLLNPLPWPEFGAVTRQAIYDLDVFGLWGVGTTWQGEFLPITVQNRPAPLQPMRDALAVGTIEKVDRHALPPGTAVDHTAHNSQRDDFRVSAPVGFVLRLYTFYWPGWTAYVDGVKTSIQVTQPEGWISVVLPAGDHRVTVRLEPTWPRQLGGSISAVAVIAVFALTLVSALTYMRRAGTTAESHPVSLPSHSAMLLTSLVLSATLARSALDYVNRWRAAHVIPNVAAAQVQRYTRFDDGLALVAYDFSATAARPGGQVPLTFYWQTVTPMSQAASVFVHFYGPDGRLWGQSDQPDPLPLFPTTRWPLGQPLPDPLTALLKPTAPPGLYTVAVGLWDRSTGLRSHVLDANGQSTDLDKLILTDQFKVAP